MLDVKNYSSDSSSDSDDEELAKLKSVAVGMFTVWDRLMFYYCHRVRGTQRRKISGQIKSRSMSDVNTVLTLNHDHMCFI